MFVYRGLRGLGDGISTATPVDSSSVAISGGALPAGWSVDQLPLFAPGQGPTQPAVDVSSLLASSSSASSGISAALPWLVGLGVFVLVLGVVKR